MDDRDRAPYDFTCQHCKGELHLAAVYDKRSVAQQALELLGWAQNRKGFICPDCSERAERR